MNEIQALGESLGQLEIDQSLSCTGKDSVTRPQHMPMDQCEAVLEARRASQASKNPDSLQAWKGIVLQSMYSPSQKWKLIKSRETWLARTAGSLSGPRAAQSFTPFPLLPQELQDQIWRAFFDDVPDFPRVVDFCSITNFSFTQRLRSNDEAHRSPIPPKMPPQDMYTPASQACYRARTILSETHHPHETKAPLVQRNHPGAQHHCLGLIKPTDILFLVEGGLFWHWGSRSTFGSTIDSRTELNSIIEGLSCSQIAVDWQCAVNTPAMGCNNAAAAVPVSRLYSSRQWEIFGDEWHFLMKMKHLKTVYFIFTADVDIRVTVDEDYQAPAGYSPDLKPSLKSVIDLYDDMSLAEVLSLQDYTRLPSSPCWSHSLSGARPCVECRRVQWEKQWKSIVEDHWLRLCREDSSLVTWEEAMGFWPLNEASPKKEHPVARRLLKAGPEFRPAIMINLNPQRGGPDDFSQMSWGHTHITCGNHRRDSATNLQLHRIRWPA